MSHSSVLASFDPLAVHPFTNTSGLLPKPAAPSQYPLPLPSPATLATAPAPAPSVVAPQPKRAGGPTHSGGAARTQKGPIFMPFRPERSSPDLEDILLKKKVHDVLANKQTWSIDHAPAPRAAVRH